MDPILLESSIVDRPVPEVGVVVYELVLAASSIISPMSLKRAPDFTRVFMGLPLALSPSCTSRRRLSPTSSVVDFDPDVGNDAWELACIRLRDDIS